MDSLPSRSNLYAVGTAAAGPPDDAMSNEVFGRRRDAVAGEVIGRGHDDTRNRRDELRGRGRIDQATEPDRDIDRVPDEILPSVFQEELNVKVGMPSHEGGQAGDGVANAEAGRHAHSQLAAKVTAVTNAVFGLLQRGEDRLHARKEFGAGLGGDDGARGSRQKPPAKIRLEIGDDAGGLGLREAAFARRRRKAAEASDARIKPKREYVFHAASRSHRLRNQTN